MLRILKTAMAALLLICGLAAPSLAATVKVLVNNAEITDTQIAARAALLRVERRGNSNNQRLKMATDELIDEQLKLQEADRLGITVSSAQVNDAFLTIARNLKLSADKLEKLLQESGVNPNTLRDRLKAGVAWQAVSRAAIAPRVQVSDLDLEKKAEAQLDTKSSFDYILKEIRFIIPKGSGASTSRRTADANQYRRSFQGCDSAVDLSLSYTDAAVIDLGRRHATQLPDAIANELAGLSTGQITKPRVVDGGVSMLAICSKSEARDTTFIKNDIEREVGSEKLKAEADQYLKRLHDRAAIVYN